MEETPKILIIDDSHYDRKAIKMYLKAGNINYEIVEAITKEDGKNSIKSEKPDLIILDYMLPDGNGLELLDEMKVDVPVVMITGQDKTGLENLAKEKGINDFLTKENYSHDHLNKVIKHILKDRGGFTFI